MLRRPHFLFYVPVLIVVIAIAVSAQALSAATSGTIKDSDVLTNADILKMVEAKLADDMIISKLKSLPNNFDTSIDAIFKLKVAGASDAVIHAMVEASPSAKTIVKEASTKEPAPDPNDPMSLHASGVYLKPTQAAVVRLETSPAGVLALATPALVAQAQVFSTPKNISNNTGESDGPRIAADSAGNIYVVWMDNVADSTSGDIFFSRSADGGATFSTPKNLSTNLGPSYFPLIAVDSSDKSFCVVARSGQEYK